MVRGCSLNTGANADVPMECLSHLKQKTGSISGEECINSEGEHLLVLVKVA